MHLLSKKKCFIIFSVSTSNSLQSGNLRAITGTPLRRGAQGVPPRPPHNARRRCAAVGNSGHLIRALKAMRGVCPPKPRRKRAGTGSLLPCRIADTFSSFMSTFRFLSDSDNFRCLMAVIGGLSVSDNGRRPPHRDDQSRASPRRPAPCIRADLVFAKGDRGHPRPRTMTTSCGGTPRRR